MYLFRWYTNLKLVAPPPRVPESVYVLFAHTEALAPAFTVATGLMVSTKESFAAEQGPEVVSLRRTLPAEMSAADGV
jgi:hypothetical protein